MRKLIADAPNILLATLAGLTSYLLLGFSIGFRALIPETMLLSALLGMIGGIIPTFWEIFTSSRDIARLSHSWLIVGILLALTHVCESPLIDALCFGYLFHLFLDTRNRKLAPAIQLKRCNRRMAYCLVAAIYVLAIAYVLYARHNVPPS